MTAPNAGTTPRPWYEDASFWITADDARYGYRERDAIRVVKVADLEAHIQQAEAALAEALAAITHAGYELRDPCDACGGVPDPREPDVVCAWCGGANKRLIRLAAYGAGEEREK